MTFPLIPSQPARGGDWLALGNALHATAVETQRRLGGVIHTNSTVSRPTDDPSIVVVFHTAAPPTTLMISNDKWEPTG